MEVGAHQVQDLDDDGVPYRIEDLIAGLAIRNKLLCPQHGEVLRDVGLFHAELLDQGAGRELSCAEELQNGDSGWVSEGLEDVGLKPTQGILHARILAYSHITQ